MSKLRIDLDVLSETRGVYETEIDQFEEAKNGIRRALISLEEKGWLTSAGRKWFGDLDGGWMRAFEDDIGVVRELSEELGNAQRKYRELLDEQEKLKNASNLLN